MTVLAVYYTVADVVLLAQCAWYRGWMGGRGKGRGGEEEEGRRESEGSEEEPMLARTDEEDESGTRASVDGTRLSPATPLLSGPDPPAPTSVLFNLAALLLVCAAGVFGWWLSIRSSPHHRHHHPPDNNNNNREAPPGTASPPPLHLDPWGQLFGYLCAGLYLLSRIPQLLLNHRRQSTEGVSVLFFLFACVGNLAYVLSILAFEPGCARERAIGAATGGGGAVVGRRAGECAAGEWKREYARYVLVNASWLLGSAGTLGLDVGIFAQFWWYRGRRAGV